MSDTQHFCLRWNNYQSSITSAFENLRDDEDFVDVTLACEGRSLKAHRVVLSACSPYFRDLLKSTPCKHPVIVLQDVAFSDLHALVEFIYHGEVNVHQSSLSSFLRTAEVLKVSGLTRQQAEETHRLAQMQNLANSGARTPISHQRYAENLVEDALFPQGVSPPLNLNNLHSANAHSGASINQFLQRAAALRRERHNSNQSDELSLKRNRQNNGILGNNNSPDVISHMPQVTPTDFSTIKHNNNNTPPMKDAERAENYSIDSPNLINNNASNGNGLSTTLTDKESLTPSPPNRLNDDVKPEPMELVCSNHNIPSDEHSNDSVGDSDGKYLGGGDGKGSLSSNNDDDIESSIHNAPTAPFLLSPTDGKFLPSSAPFSFQMALAGDPTFAGLNSQLHSAVELSGSPQGPQSAVVSASSSSSSSSSQLRMPPPTSGGINEPQECPYCRRTFSCYYSLKRHFQDKHEQSDTLYVCEFCHRRYRTKNSLTTHKSLQHRGSSGMLKRLLKTSAIKNVLGPHHGPQHSRPHLFDFAAELGQPPPGMPFKDFSLNNAIIKDEKEKNIFI